MRKGTAIFLCALFLLIVLSSVAFMAAEADHDCDGEHCPVCLTIRFLRGMARSAFAVRLFVCSVVFAAVCLRIRPSSDARKADRALIRLKVKLSL